MINLALLYELVKDQRTSKFQQFFSRSQTIREMVAPHWSYQDHLRHLDDPDSPAMRNND